MNKSPKVFPAKAIPFLYHYAKIYKWYILVSFLLILSDVGVANLRNWFFAQIIEVVKGGVSESAMQSAITFVCLLGVCVVFNIFWPRICILYRQKNVYFPIEAEIVKDFLAYIQGHSYSYITSIQTGTLVNKINQASSIQSVFSMILVGSWSIICQIVVKTSILIMVNLWLGLLFLGCAVLSYGFNTLINRRAEHLSKMSNRIEAIYGGRLVDIVANIRLVKQFNRLMFEQNKLFILLKQQFDIKKKELGEGLRTYTAVGIFINLCCMVIITFAVYLWSLGQINVGDIVFVLLTLTMGLNSLIELHDIIRRLRNSLAAMSEGLQPFVVPHGITDAPNASKLKIVDGTIEFKNVSFAYNSNKKIFDSFNFKIKAKEKIGLVGVSGSGKTTLINLLQRAYEPDSGRIEIDGQNIADVTQKSLHSAIALIPQETTLFHRTIAENIMFGNPAANKKKMLAACRKAYADGFIRNLPEGYETLVGDRGCRLSGGEKQRIAIARAILKNSPILILDEATSALDSKSEHFISQAILELIADKTVIAVAHRLSTLKEMDRIVVLEQGKIVEEGNYTELIRRKNGKFYRFYQLQKMNGKKGTTHENV